MTKAIATFVIVMASIVY
jgi:hypothetical protein